MSQEMKRKAYPSDLSEAQWERLSPLLPQPGPEDRPLEHSRREIINAIFYVLRTGCAWRQLPHDLPPWQTVSWYLRRWQKDGTWERVSSTLRQQVRVQMGREAEPSAVIIDSQSIKSSPVRGTDRGYDAYKKIRGRKRHLVVDTQGFLLAVKVTAANLSDRYPAQPLLQRVASLLPRVGHLWADHAYAGPLEDWVRQQLGWSMQIVASPAQPKRTLVFHWVDGFPVHEWATTLLPAAHRWVVERSFAWLIRFRRLARDYEGLPVVSEVLIHLAFVRLWLSRLAPKS